MEIFKEINALVNQSLKQIGFVKKGSSFYFETNKNFGVINFQLSRESTKHVVRFTINFGVYSYLLGQLQHNYNNSIKPKVEQCHWHARIGDFMTGSPDFWWEIKVSDDLNGFATNVIDNVKNIAVPEINKRLSDEGLLNCLMNEAFAGTTEIGRFKYVTTLLKAKRDFDTLNQVVDVFMEKSKGKPNASIAMEHLKEIEFFR